MEGIFNSKDLYEYLEDQKQLHISKTREISLYYKATSKSVEDDEYSLRIWLDYIQLLIDGTKDMTEARETFRMIKMRFCKFYGYWEAYIRFEITAKSENLGKILQQSIDFVRVKEFGEKKNVLEYLECIISHFNNGDDLSMFCSGSTRDGTQAANGIKGPYGKENVDDGCSKVSKNKEIPGSTRIDSRICKSIGNMNELNFSEDENFEFHMGKVRRNKSPTKGFSYSPAVKKERTEARKSESRGGNEKVHARASENLDNIANTPSSLGYLMESDEYFSGKTRNSKSSVFYEQKENFEGFGNEVSKSLGKTGCAYDEAVAGMMGIRIGTEKSGNSIGNSRIFNETGQLHNKSNAWDERSTERINGRLRFSPNSKGEPWSVKKPISRKSPGRGIPVQLEKENYTQGITAEINAVLGRKNGTENSLSPKMDSVQPREKILIKNREVEILKQIGKGGSSKVYKVLVGTNIYALKKVELVGDEKMLTSYINEINLLYKFKGASEIVEIIDHEIGGDYLHILLEYGETDLAKIIKNGNLSMNFVKDVWEQMLLIVKRVHRERIIHCDLKPANFLFVKGRVKLIDFGISKVIRNDTTSILSEEQCGTVNYMSPEAVTQNKSKVARSSDIWSLGCILYEMVHSKPPLYEYPNLIQKIQRLQEYSEFKYTSKHRLAVMVMKECLVRDPKKRAGIDRLLNHRFLKGEVEPECLEALIEKVLRINERMDPSSSYISEVIDQFYKS